MPKEDGYESAVQLAVSKLRQVDLAHRCAGLGLEVPENGQLKIRAFGRDHVLDLVDYSLAYADSDVPVRVWDKILVLHYLLCDYPVIFNDQMISFRDLSGGQFYWGPFRARSLMPLEKRFGNATAALKENLDRFDWEPVSIGDLGARIHVIGNLYVTLIYRIGDDELPSAADLLFDSAIKRVFNAEDAAVLAGRICIGLL